jgi:hypothetical protein
MLGRTRNIQKPSGAKLLTQVRHALRARRYSMRTEEVYVQWIRRFILFHDKRHPRDMGAAEVNSSFRTSPSPIMWRHPHKIRPYAPSRPWPSRRPGTGQKAQETAGGVDR